MDWWMFSCLPSVIVLAWCVYVTVETCIQNLKRCLPPLPCRVCSSCLPTLDWWRFPWPTVPTTWAAESACSPETPTAPGPGGCVRTWGWRHPTGERSHARLRIEARSCFPRFSFVYLKRGVSGTSPVFLLPSVTGSRTWRRRTRRPFVTEPLWVPDQPDLQLHVSVAPGLRFACSINFEALYLNEIPTVTLKGI